MGMLVFLYKGKYYIIHNSCDSYPDVMVSILKQLFELLRHKFHGDVKSACQYWGELLIKIPWAVRNRGNKPKKAHPFNTGGHAFKDNEKSLHDTTAHVVYQHDVVSEYHVYKHFEDFCLETTDLDDGFLSLYCDNDPEKYLFMITSSRTSTV